MHKGCYLILLGLNWYSLAHITLPEIEPWGFSNCIHGIPVSGVVFNPSNTPLRASDSNNNNNNSPFRRLSGGHQLAILQAPLSIFEHGLSSLS